MDADKPFDANATTDTVIRSSDNIHFYVVGALLSYISPVFRDLFSLNQGPSTDENETKNGYPVIPLPEDSESIRNLLNIIYPYINKPKLDDTQLFIKVGKMAKKYGMDTIVGKLKKRLNNDRWMVQQPHKAFVIAVLLLWDEERMAAMKMLELSQDIPYCEEFRSINGADYYGLLKYRFRRRHKQQENLVPQTEERQHVASEHETVVSTEMHEKDSSASPSKDCNSGDETKIVHDADEPFHSNTMADIILRSSDYIDFYVPRIMLQFISSTFRELFANPEEKGSKNGLDVISITEGSEVVRYFLLMIYYHKDVPSTTNLGLFWDLCNISRKYGVSPIEERLKKQLTNSSLLVHQPFRVYVIATALRWSDVAIVAARNTLSTPPQDTVSGVPELVYITGAELYRLMDYRTRCANTAYTVIKMNNHHQNFAPLNFTSYRSTETLNYKGYIVLPDLKTGALSGSKIIERLAACPRGATYADAFASEFQTSVEQRKDHYLTVSSAHDAFKCCKEVADAIEIAVAKVPLVDTVKVPAARENSSKVSNVGFGRGKFRKGRGRGYPPDIP
ncbi:hypothetical protein AX15_001635 [Amanita polypyramis BW_CC]|nr:hypothetical protein AX15_001635 [Amanita polypyramis BW_CC]